MGIRQLLLSEILYFPGHGRALSIPASRSGFRRFYSVSQKEQE
jgi:hypothetical protein